MRELDRTFQQEKFQEKVFSPAICCCISKGDSKVKFFCAGDVYMPGNEAKIQYEIDNTNCQAEIPKVYAKLIQEVTLGKGHGNDDIRRVTNVFSTNEFSGHAAGEAIAIRDITCRIALDNPKNYHPDETIDSEIRAKSDEKELY
jgi:hypothetical protein